MTGWVRICGTCWYEQRPDEYFPPHTEYGRCNWCGDEALTVGVRTVSFTVVPTPPVCDIGPAQLPEEATE